MNERRKLADNWNRASDLMWKALERWLRKPDERNLQKYHDAVGASICAYERFMDAVCPDWREKQGRAS